MHTWICGGSARGCSIWIGKLGNCVMEHCPRDSMELDPSIQAHSLFVRLVADGWCWFVLREKYCWLVASGWFVLREKYCWLVADKPNEQGVNASKITGVRSLDWNGRWSGGWQCWTGDQQRKYTAIFLSGSVHALGTKNMNQWGIPFWKFSTELQHHLSGSLSESPFRM
jgi:hypothetical protein